MLERELEEGKEQSASQAAEIQAQAAKIETQTAKLETQAAQIRALKRQVDEAEFAEPNPIDLQADFDALRIELNEALTRVQQLTSEKISREQEGKRGFDPHPSPFSSQAIGPQEKPLWGSSRDSGVTSLLGKRKPSFGSHDLSQQLDPSNQSVVSTQNKKKLKILSEQEPKGNEGFPFPERELAAYRTSFGRRPSQSPQNDGTKIIVKLPPPSVLCNKPPATAETIDLSQLPPRDTRSSSSDSLASWAKKDLGIPADKSYLKTFPATSREVPAKPEEKFPWGTPKSATPQISGGLASALEHPSSTPVTAAIPAVRDTSTLTDEELYLRLQREKEQQRLEKG